MSYSIEEIEQALSILRKVELQMKVRKVIASRCAEIVLEVSTDPNNLPTSIADNSIRIRHKIRCEFGLGDTRKV